jgi:hypothetical protein
LIKKTLDITSEIGKMPKGWPKSIEKETRSYLKIRILGRDKDEAEDQPDLPVDGILQGRINLRRAYLSMARI